MILAVTGTGTGVGKTHVACALIQAARAQGVRAIGYKPVESGVTGAVGEDEAALREASGGEVAPPTLRLPEPLSPHLAARRAGRSIDGAAIADTLATLAARWPLVVLELAGGLCSPFDDQLDNLDWLAIHAPRVVIVAPDRLGVLHDTSVVLRACRGAALDVRAIVLGAPPIADASTGSNVGELAARPLARGVAVIGVPRAASTALAADPGLRALAAPSAIVGH